jgi:hypothetical protein
MGARRHCRGLGRRFPGLQDGALTLIIPVSSRAVRIAEKVSTEHGDIESNRDQKAPEKARPPQEETALPLLSERLQSFTSTDLRRFQGSEDLAADDRSGGAHSVAPSHRQLRQVSTGGASRGADGPVHGTLTVRLRRIARSQRPFRQGQIGIGRTEAQESPWSPAAPHEIPRDCDRFRPVLDGTITRLHRHRPWHARPARTSPV